jgi:ATP-dependent RNA helicase DeaD
VDVIEELKMQSIARQFGVPIEERELPGDDDVQALMSERAIALLEAKMRTRDLLQKERQERFGPLAKSLGENEELRPLMAMLLDEFYQSCVAKPVAVPRDTGKKGKKDPVRSEPRKRPRRRPRKKRPAARKDGAGSPATSNRNERNQTAPSNKQE